MAEFCKDCFDNLFEIEDNEEVVLSDDPDLCEGCGKRKRVVIAVQEKVKFKDKQLK